jgi:hypothetical protein
LSPNPSCPAAWSICQAAGLKSRTSPSSSDDSSKTSKTCPEKPRLELLKRILNEEIAVKGEKNVVKARTFAGMLEDASNATQPGDRDGAAYRELVQMAKDFRDQRKEGVNLASATMKKPSTTPRRQQRRRRGHGRRKLASIARELSPPSARTLPWTGTSAKASAPTPPPHQTHLRNTAIRPPRRSCRPFVIEQAEVICKDV